MSKKTPEREIGYGGGWLIQDYQISHLEGRLLTLMESIGLRDTQEKAVKDLVRAEVWKLLEPCFWISSEDHNMLRDKYAKSGNGIPRPVGGSISPR